MCSVVSLTESRFGQQRARENHKQTEADTSGSMNCGSHIGLRDRCIGAFYQLRAKK